MRRFRISLLAFLAFLPALVGVLVEVGVLTKHTAKADSIGGGGVLPTSSVVISGTPTAGNCVQWLNSTTVKDFGGACGSGGGAAITGTPVAGQITDWASATNIQGITTGTGVVTAIGVNTNTNGGFLTMTGAPGTGVQTALTVNTNASGGSVLLNGSPAATDCLQWSSTGAQDFGNPCSPSGQISGRVTLTTGVPVLTASVSASTTVYYTPYNGNTIPIWSSTLSKFVWTPFSEVSQLTTDTTKSPAAVTTNSNYDIFCWSDSGTFRCTRGPAWTSSTARGTGAGTTQLSLVQGIWVNTNAITNGPGAAAGTYVGSFRSNGSSTVDFTFAGAGAGGVAGVVGVWSYYNRVPIQMTTQDTSTSYTYSSATIRESRASAGNQVSFISGMAEDSEMATIARGVQTPAVSGAYMGIGIGLDTTVAFTNGAYIIAFSPTANVNTVRVSTTLMFPAQLGWHTVSANEGGDGTNAATIDLNAIDALDVMLRF